jgi:hypothetical protein
MTQRHFHIVLSTSGFLFLLAASSTLAGIGKSSSKAEEGKDVTVTQGSDGALVGTLHGGAGEVHFEHGKDCDIYNNGKHEPCFIFMGSAPSSGEAPVDMPVSGCPHGNGNLPSAVTCPTAGVKSIIVVLENGGHAFVGSESGAIPCSPVPISVEAHSTDDNPAGVDVKDDCTESVSCPGQGSSQVNADDGDTVKANCSVITQPRGTRFNFPH